MQLPRFLTVLSLSSLALAFPQVIVKCNFPNTISVYIGVTTGSGPGVEQGREYCRFKTSPDGGKTEHMDLEGPCRKGMSMDPVEVVTQTGTYSVELVTNRQDLRYCKSNGDSCYPRLTHNGHSYDMWKDPQCVMGNDGYSGAVPPEDGFWWRCTVKC